MKKKSPRLAIEALEDRNLMSVWNMPWPNAAHLTASFVPDGTNVDGAPSALYQALGSDTGSWQLEILRALQTWAVNANINIAVVQDGGQDLGASGLLQGDARFGDIRLAAAPLGTESLDQQHLAVGSPYSPLAGTSSGDILFNSNQSLGVGNQAAYDLFTVALHEAGHVFGFADENTDPTSANYFQYQGPRTGLSPGDIAMLQTLYGVRTGDAYEATSGNETLATATPITAPNVAGDITTAGDVDCFRYVLPAFTSSSATVTVQTSGVSLLTPRLSVYDANGALLGTASAVDPLHGDVSVALSNVSPGEILYFKVESARADVFGIGAYRLKIDSGAVSREEIAGIDALLSGSVVGASTIGQSWVSAVPLDQAAFAAQAHFDYAVAAAIGAAGEEHIYSIATPLGSSETVQSLLLTVTSGQGSALNPRITVYNASGQEVAFQVLSNDAGSYVVQIVNPVAGATYFVKVSADVGAANATGEYVLGASFRDAAIVLESLASSTLTDANNAQVVALQSSNFQIYHFVLAVNSGAAAADLAVRMQLFDSAGHVVLTLDALDGQTVSANVNLDKATYYARFFGARQDGSAISSMWYQLTGTNLTDPMDPIPIDPGDITPPPPSSLPPPPITVVAPEITPLPPVDPTSNPWLPPTTVATTTPPPIAPPPTTPPPTTPPPTTPPPTTPPPTTTTTSSSAPTTTTSTPPPDTTTTTTTTSSTPPPSTTTTTSTTATTTSTTTTAPPPTAPPPTAPPPTTTTTTTTTTTSTMPMI